MKERPILFSGEMVRTILAGRKTVTRRPFDPEKFGTCGDALKACPYGQPGDRLWVAEACPFPGDMTIEYKADLANPTGSWRGPQHCTREMSRITLEITGVRVERLQEISQEGARAEGFPLAEHQDDLHAALASTGGRLRRSVAEISFGCTWDSLNASRGFGWSANPFVWVIEFKRV